MTHEERFTKIENALSTTAENLAQMSAHQAEHDEDLKEMRQLNKSLMVAVGKIAEQHAEAHRYTDEKLNILIQAQIETEHKLQRWIDGNGPAAS